MIVSDHKLQLHDSVRPSSGCIHNVYEETFLCTFIFSDKYITQQITKKRHYMNTIDEKTKKKAHT